MLGTFSGMWPIWAFQKYKLYWSYNGAKLSLWYFQGAGSSSLDLGRSPKGNSEGTSELVGYARPNFVGQKRPLKLLNS